MKIITEAAICERLGQRVRLDIEPKLISLLGVCDEPKNMAGGVSYIGRLMKGWQVVDYEVLDRFWNIQHQARRPALVVDIKGRLVDPRSRISPYDPLVVAYDAQQRHLASIRKAYALQGDETLYFAQGDGFEQTGFTVGDIAIQPMDEENQQRLVTIREKRRLRAAWRSIGW